VNTNDQDSEVFCKLQNLKSKHMQRFIPLLALMTNNCKDALEN